MVWRVTRIYVDTSVFGGCFDPEFADPSRRLFDQVRAGRFTLVTSPLVQAEIAPAPSTVVELFDEMAALAELINVDEEALQIQAAYLNARIVSPAYATDALHVALATVGQCRVLASWNFKHIVHFQKIPLYNAINVTAGYDPIAIHAPHEVVQYEDQDV